MSKTSIKRRLPAFVLSALLLFSCGSSFSRAFAEDVEKTALFSEDFEADNYVVGSKIPGGGTGMCWQSNRIENAIIMQESSANKFALIGSPAGASKLTMKDNCIPKTAPIAFSGKFQLMDTANEGVANHKPMFFMMWKSGGVSCPILFYVNYNSAASNYDIYIGGAAKTSAETAISNSVKIGCANVGKWLSFTAYINPNANAALDWASAALTVYINGAVQDTEGNAQNQIKGYLPSFDSGIGAGRSAYFGVRTATTDSIGVDDFEVYYPGTLAAVAASPASDVPVNSVVELLFNNNLDFSTIDINAVAVTSAVGGNVTATNVSFDAAKPNCILLDFSKNLLSEATVYTVTIQDSLKDVFGKGIGACNRIVFQTGSANARLAALTYTVNGGETTAVSGFSRSDNSSQYTVEIVDNSAVVVLSAAVLDMNSKMQMIPADGVVAIKDGNGTASVTVTSSKGESNTYTVHFRVYDEITALTINTPQNLAQDLEALEPVSFSAVPTPSTNVKEASILWYVDGLLQTQSGCAFRYMPSARGNHKVYAVVEGTAVQSETVIVSVTSEADKYYTELLTDTFGSAKYVVDQSVPTATGGGAWLHSNGSVVKRDAAGNKYALLGSAGNGSYLDGVVSLSTQFVVSTRLMVHSESTGKVGVGLYGVGLTNNMLSFSEAGDAYALDFCGTPTNIGIEKDQLLQYDIFVQPSLTADGACDWTKCKMTLYISGNLKNENGESAEQLIFEKDSFNIGYPTKNMVRFYTQTGGIASVDDVLVYQPGIQPVAAAIHNRMNIPVLGNAVLQLDTALDATTLTANSITATPVGGGKSVTPALSLNGGDPSELVLSFANANLNWHTEYEITIADSVKTVSGNTIYAKNTFVTNEQNARLSSLTYQANGGAAIAVPEFATEDDSKNYVISFVNQSPSTVQLNPTAADFGASVVISPSGGIMSFDGADKSMTVTVTSQDGTKTNTYTVTFRNADAITALTINTPENLTQTSDMLSEVSFVVTTPETNIDETSINWYVNDVCQPQKGLNFCFAPTGDGIYDVCAKVSGSEVASEHKMLRVGDVSEMVPVSSIVIDPEALHLWEDFDLPCVLYTEILPENATNKVLHFTSSNPGVATVDPITGNVKPISEGVAVITATATDGSLVKSVNSFELTVTSAQNRANNQKMNLDPVLDGKKRIDKYKFLSWPENVGEGQVALWSKNATGAFSITADDGLTYDFPYWNSFKDKYGYPITLFVIGRVESNPANLKMWEDEINIEGQDVQSHSFHHYSSTIAPTLTSAQTIFEYERPVDIINGIENGNCVTIAHAWGYADIPYSRKFYIAGRSTPVAPNYVDTVDYNCTNKFSVTDFYDSTSDLSMETIVKGLYDTSYTVRGKELYGGWSITLDHQISGDPSYKEELGMEASRVDFLDLAFQRILKPAADRGAVWPATFTQAAMYGQERDTSVLTVTENKSGSIKYTLTDEMDDTLFTYPLTVKLKVDESWGGVKAVQNGKELELTEKAANGSRYVLIETVPDRGEVSVYPTAAPTKKFTGAIDIMADTTKQIATATLLYENADDAWSTEYKLYVAGYDDSGLLCSVESSDMKTISALDSGITDVSLSFDNQVKKLKAFAINSDCLKPLCMPSEKIIG